MKKAIIFAVLFAFLLSAGSIFAAVKWSDTKRLQNEEVQLIYSRAFDTEKIRVLKFHDDGNICYMAYQGAGGYALTPSLECKFK